MLVDSDCTISIEHRNIWVNMKLIDLLVRELRSSASYNSNIQVAPSVVLWTDKLRQWESALPLMQAAMPELLVLGDYQPEKRQGPAIWLKCVIEGVLPEFELPEGNTPILYLPGYERRDLRAIAKCPDELKPLAELQYRGSWWVYNTAGRDWTVNAFLLSSSGGAGLDVAADKSTQAALLKVLPEILESERADLANKRLEAPDFNKLISSDPIRDLLTWMNEPKPARERWDDKRWDALVSIWETEFHFNPKKDGELTAAELLCRRQGPWEGVWQRYAETCNHYSELPDLLLKVEPDLAADGASYPALNATEEQKLETELNKLRSGASCSDVRTALQQFEKEHSERRNWIWFGLGLSPLAGVIEHLAQVAKLTDRAFNGSTVDEMAQQYKDLYWQADDQVLRALAYPLKNQQQGLIQELLHVIYGPWLEEVTTNFQNLVARHGYDGELVARESTAEYQSGGEVVFFVDGLRFDVAKRLCARLEKLGKLTLSHDWAALPSVTATAKAAVTPVHDRLTGRTTDKDFQPSLVESEASFSSHYLKKYLAEKGWVYLSETETGDPSTNAWVQSGDIDKEGHLKGLKLANRIDPLLDEIVERVEDLFSASWRRIRIVTDHGWLLTPSTMAKVEIAKYLTETRWGRCALVKDNVQTEHLKVGWYWNKDVTVAIAPGIRNFTAGKHYDHGGLSLQECFTPVIDLINNQPVTAKPTVNATINEIRWVGLVGKLSCEVEGDGVVAVLRTQPGNAESEISPRKPLKDGKCTLMVDDEFEQTSAVVVLLDEAGNVIAKQPTIVGGDD